MSATWDPQDPAVYWQWGCAGTHHGVGTPDCPRERHHHHDEHCTVPATRAPVLPARPQADPLFPYASWSVTR